jgi:hypothetical protein
LEEGDRKTQAQDGVRFLLLGVYQTSGNLLLYFAFYKKEQAHALP